MTNDQQRDAKRLAEVLDHNGSCTRSGDPVVGAHRTTLVDEQANGKVDRLRRESGIIEDAAIVPIERMLIKSFPNQESCLLPALPPIAESGTDTMVRCFPSMH